MKITTVLLMKEVEPSLEFWTKRLGFDVTVSVPHEDKVGFVILTNGTAELMMQSHASAANDVATLNDFQLSSRAALFIEVKDFDDVLKRLDGYPVALPIRETFYGMKEVGVFEPGGNFVVFAWPMPK